MRWHVPCCGETRIKKGFLLFPKKANLEYRWLTIGKSAGNAINGAANRSHYKQFMKERNAVENKYKLKGDYRYPSREVIGEVEFKKFQKEYDDVRRKFGFLKD